MEKTVTSDNKENINTINKEEEKLTQHINFNDKKEKKKYYYTQNLELQRTFKTLNKCPTLCKPYIEEEFNEIIQKIRNFKSSYHKGQFCKYYLRGCCIDKPEDCQFAHSIKEFNVENYRRLLKDFEQIKHTCELVDNLQRGWALAGNNYPIIYEYMLEHTSYKFSKYQINNLAGKRHVIRQIMLRDIFNEFYDILLDQVINKDLNDHEKMDYIPIKELNEYYLKAAAIKVKYEQSHYFFIKDSITNKKDKKVSVIRRVPSIEVMDKYYKNLLIKKIDEYVGIIVNGANNNSEISNESNTKIIAEEKQEKRSVSPVEDNSNIKENTKKTKVKKEKKIKKEKAIPLNHIFPLTSKFIKRVLATQTDHNFPDIFSSYFKLKNIDDLEYLQELILDTDFVEKIITIAKKAGLELNKENMVSIPNNLELFLTTFNELNAELNKNSKDLFYVNLNDIVYNSKFKNFITPNIGFSVKDLKFLIKSMYLCTNETRLEMKKKLSKDSNKNLPNNVLQYILFRNNNSKCFIFNFKKFLDFDVNKLMSKEIFERCSYLSEPIQQELADDEDEDEEGSKPNNKDINKEDKILNNIIDMIDAQFKIISQNQKLLDIKENVETYTFESKYQESFKVTMINNYKSLKEFVLLSPYIKTIGIDLEGKLSSNNVYIQLIQCHCSFKNEDNNKVIESQVFIFDLHFIKERIFYYSNNNIIENKKNALLYSELFFHIQLTLTKVFENQNIIKIFHDCRGDLNALHKELRICVNNVLDISCLHIFNQQLIAHKSLKDNHFNELNQSSFEKLFLEKDKFLDSMFSEFYNDMYCSTLPSLNKILEKYLNKTNYLKEKIGAMFNDSKYSSFFLARPIEKDWLNYSTLDVIYLEDSVKVLEDNIFNNIKTLGYGDVFKNREDIRILSMLISNDHAKCSCEREEEEREKNDDEEKGESTYSNISDKENK